MYGGWPIYEVELMEILGWDWGDIRSREYGGLLGVEPDGTTPSGMRWWRLQKLRDFAFPSDRGLRAGLASSLEGRYRDRVHRIPAERRHCWVADVSLFSGYKVTATTLCEMLGMRWRTFKLMIGRSEFPEPDSNQFQNQKGDWWWATTIVRHFPEDLELIDALGRRYVPEWQRKRGW